MFQRAIEAGLTLAFPGAPVPATSPSELITDEAAITPNHAEHLRLDMMVAEEAPVVAGAPVARLRDHPEITLVAPMPARVAQVRLGPGRQLKEIVLFREDGADRLTHDVTTARTGDAAAVRALMQASGLWRSLRSRPFGHMPGVAEIPSAIMVMAADSRPFAPDPAAMLDAREEDLLRGLAALGRLTEGPVYLCQRAGAPLAGPGAVEGRLKRLTCGARHPGGLAGFQIHRHHPASVAAPVWDLHVEDVADLGTLLATGQRPMLRTVAVAGAAMTEARLVRCQEGASLRGLCHGFTLPGAQQLLLGSPLEGREGSWLGPRDRLLSVLPRHGRAPRGHWFRAALTRAARPLPLIPSAALDQATGGMLAGIALLRALSAGDDETLVALGGLSLLEEDLALADYVTAAEPRLSDLLRGALERIAAEEAA